jgi:hypothetical protein
MKPADHNLAQHAKASQMMSYESLLSQNMMLSLENKILMTAVEESIDCYADGDGQGIEKRLFAAAREVHRLRHTLEWSKIE